MIGGWLWLIKTNIQQMMGMILAIIIGIVMVIGDGESLHPIILYKYPPNRNPGLAWISSFWGPVYSVYLRSRGRDQITWNTFIDDHDICQKCYIVLNYHHEHYMFRIIVCISLYNIIYIYNYIYIYLSSTMFI